MGTRCPHVKITAATHAGGDKNQDRFAYGDGWAFVLDGASSFTKTQPEHDGGWYAEQLKRALSKGLTDHPERPTPAIVAVSIQAVADSHGGDEASCPTSTIALARWDGDKVETYVLGDSTAVWISAEGEEVISDSRLADIARPIREEYRTRLSAGHGFDQCHRELLQELQVQQAAVRNHPGGYWIAGIAPEAAKQGIAATRRLDTLRAVVLATDGATFGLRYGTLPNWNAVRTRSPDETLAQVHLVEEADPHAQKWPRSKLHDDKSIVIIDFCKQPSIADSGERLRP